MKPKTRIRRDDVLSAILIHFQPRPSGGHDSSLPPDWRAATRALAQTPPGQPRDKQMDAYAAEQDWRSNLSFVTGLYTLIPPDNSVLRTEAENLLRRMFGKSFSPDRLTRFNSAGRKRIKKNGEAAWRLAKKLRKHYGFPAE